MHGHVLAQPYIACITNVVFKVLLLLCRYAGSHQIKSVANKLKKFDTVMRECGDVKLGLQVGATAAAWLGWRHEPATAMLQHATALGALRVVMVAVRWR